MLESAIALNSSKTQRLSLASTKEKHCRAHVQGKPVTHPHFTLPSASTVGSPLAEAFFQTFFFHLQQEKCAFLKTSSFQEKFIIICKRAQNTSEATIFLFSPGIYAKLMLQQFVVRTVERAYAYAHTCPYAQNHSTMMPHFVLCLLKDIFGNKIHFRVRRK